MKILRVGKFLYGALGSLTASFLSAQLAPPPYVTDFETAAEFQAGNLNGQHAWAVVQGAALVSSTSVFSGATSVELLAGSPPAKITRQFFQASGWHIYYVDFWARPVAAMSVENGSILEAEGAKISFLRVDSSGQVMVWNGDGVGGGSWVPTNFFVPVSTAGQASQFHRFTIRLDYSSKQWSLYVDATLAASGLGLTSNAVTYLAQLGFGSTTFAPSYLDSLYVGNDNPLFVDSDEDGLPDNWEQKWLGTLSYGPTDDPGNVGRTLLQSYTSNQSPWPAPLVANGLRAWYRADLGVVRDGNNKVRVWADLSGQGAAVEENTAGDQPLWSPTGLGGKPSIQFDGQHSRLVNEGVVDLLGGSDELTVFAVLNPGSPQSYVARVIEGQLRFWLDSEAALSWYVPSSDWQESQRMNVSAGQRQIIEFVKSGTVIDNYKNGTKISTKSVALALPKTGGQLSIAASLPWGSNYNGQIAEIQIYNRALTASERQQIETSLMSRYVLDDSDNDGLSDSWEQKWLGTLSYGPTDDPGNVGRTLLQSYSGDQSPWPAPVVVNGLRAWYRADLGVVKDGNNKVRFWTDLSGQGVGVEENTAGDQPLWIPTSLGGKPSIQFDGQHSRLVHEGVVDLLGGSNELTVFAVVNPGSPQSYMARVIEGQFRFWLDSEAALSWYVPSSDWQESERMNVNAGQRQIIEFVKSGTTIENYINGTKISTKSVALALPKTGGQLSIAAGIPWGSNYNGQIAEIQIYNRALTVSERQQVEAHLTSRYLSDSTPATDSDGNGLPDNWEMQYFGHIGIDPHADPDGDGLDNIAEYRLGRNPAKGAVTDTMGAVNLRVYAPR